MNDRNARNPCRYFFFFHASKFRRHVYTHLANVCVEPVFAILFLNTRSDIFRSMLESAKTATRLRGIPLPKWNEIASNIQHEHECVLFFLLFICGACNNTNNQPVDLIYLQFSYCVMMVAMIFCGCAKDQSISTHSGTVGWIYRNVVCILFMNTWCDWWIQKYIRVVCHNYDCRSDTNTLDFNHIVILWWTLCEWECEIFNAFAVCTD